MKKLAVTLLYFITIFIIIVLSGFQPINGFYSLNDEHDRTCLEVEVCHDISDYKRVTEGDAYPYEHCICHGELPDSSLVIEVKGPRTVECDSEVNYTIIIHGGPGASYGYGVNASSGTLQKHYHTIPQGSNEFEIIYTAPSDPQMVNITFVGLSSDGDLKAQPENKSEPGDWWNTHRITVEIIKSPTNGIDNTNGITDTSGKSDEEYNIVLISAIIILIVIIVIIVVLIAKKVRSKKSSSKK